MQPFDLSTKNSVEPAPTPFSRLRAIAAFPFSMHGVIFANRTSLSTKDGKPFDTSAKERVSRSSIAPCSSDTAAIGTNETNCEGATFAFRRGLISTTSPSACAGHVFTPPAPAVPPPAFRCPQGFRSRPPAIPPAARADRGVPPPRGFRDDSGRRRGSSPRARLS